MFALNLHIWNKSLGDIDDIERRFVLIYAEAI